MDKAEIRRRAEEAALQCVVPNARIARTEYEKAAVKNLTPHFERAISEAVEASEKRAEAAEALAKARGEALDNLTMQGVRLEVAPGWACVPEVEWEAALAGTAGGEGEKAS